MDSNIELLNCIYQNAEMGKSSTKDVIDICEDDEFKTVLQKHYNEFERIYDTAENKIVSANEDPKHLSTFSKVSTDIMLNIKTLTDKTPSHLSQIMIQGDTMGIIDITKKLHEYNDASQDILDLGNDLLQFEQNTIDELKKFLN